MGGRVSRTDFEWVSDDQAHTKRRKDIIAAHPEVKQLFGHDPGLKWEVSGMVLVQFWMMYVMHDQSWTAIFLVGYCFGGIISHALLLAIHEISHNLAFGHKHLWANRYFGMFANLPAGIPFAQTFKKYHNEHHLYLNTQKYDTDCPTYLEAKLFNTTLGKMCWVFLQPFFYGFRPILVYPKSIEVLEVANLIVQVGFDCIVYYVFGGKVLVYMIVGSLSTMGLHPLGGHFISEHYMFEKGFDTFSYYGCFNYVLFNVGYHMEHHDFPFVAGSRLPELKRIAPEFYDTLPYHTSLVKVLWDFVTDPAIGPYARQMRTLQGLQE